MTDIREEPWFFQEMAPLLATAVLKPLQDGAFLVRSFKRRLALSFVSDSGVKHLWIHRDEDGMCYVLRHDKFSSIRDMIDRYRTSRSLGLPLVRYPQPEDVEQFLRLPSSDIELGPESADGTDSQLTSFHHGRYGDEAVTAVCRRFNSTEITTCLRNEAAILMLLDNANVLRLMGLHTPGHGQYALVVEHVNCGNLRQFLHRQGDSLLRDWEILVSFTQQVASGLAYLHKKSIVHCDLVLENCLIERTDRFTVKLAGLLFARFEGTEPQPLVQLLWRRCCRVSPPCPESADDEAAAADLMAPLPSPPTAASDVWAFGLLLWSAFTLARCHQLTEPLSLGCGHLPHELACSLEHLVRSCLYELPQLRISASELSKQLRNLMDLRSQLCDKYVPTATYSSLGAPFSSSGVPSPSPSSNQILSSSDAGCSSADSVKKDRKPRLFFRRSKKWKAPQGSLPRSQTVDGGLQREAPAAAVVASTPPLPATVSTCGSGGGNGGGKRRGGGLRHLFSRNRGDRGRNANSPSLPSAGAAEVPPLPPTATAAVSVQSAAKATGAAAVAARISRSQSDHQIGAQAAPVPSVKQGRTARLGQVAEYVQAESVNSVTSQLTGSQRTDSSFQLSAGGGSVQQDASGGDSRYERLLAQARQLRARFQAERLGGQELRRRLESCEVRLADAEAEARQWRQEAALRQRQTQRLRQEAADATAQLLTMRADYERLLCEFAAVEARLQPLQPPHLPPPPPSSVPLQSSPPPQPLPPPQPSTEPIGSHDSGIGLAQSESAYSLIRGAAKLGQVTAAPVPLRPPRPVRTSAASAAPVLGPSSPRPPAHQSHQRQKMIQQPHYQNHQLRPQSEA